MRRTHVRGGEISVIQEKTKTRLWIPLHRDLRPILEDLPKTSVFLADELKGHAVDAGWLSRELASRDGSPPLPRAAEAQAGLPRAAQVIGRVSARGGGHPGPGGGHPSGVTPEG